MLEMPTWPELITCGLTILAAVVAVYKAGQTEGGSRGRYVTIEQMDVCQAREGEQLEQLHEKVNGVASDVSEIKGYVKGILEKSG